MGAGRALLLQSGVVGGAFRKYQSAGAAGLIFRERPGRARRPPMRGPEDWRCFQRLPLGVKQERMRVGWRPHQLPAQICVLGREGFRAASGLG